VPTREVELTAYHEELIDRLVKSGRYRNASEVIGEGLSLIEQRETLEAAKLEALREAARIGFADLDEGRYVEFVSMDELEHYIGQLGREAEERARKGRA
jgi:antitoxin ParD1/3/4